ncbi:MAG: hemerythrin domain-containing protein [Janthinobacterium lividum]
MPTEKHLETAADAIELLKQDHAEVDKLFKSFESADPKEKRRIADVVSAMLTVHAEIEEKIFYPAAKKALAEAGADLVEEALVEHFLVKTLIDKLLNMEVADQGFDATFKVLTENVQHHVEEEETELFPKVRRTSLDLRDLGEQLSERKEALYTKLQAASAHAPA